MKIIEVNLLKEITEMVGLRPISMKKIGNTILLAGKNGSGKTRLLNIIRQQTDNLPQFLQQKQSSKDQIKQAEQQIAQQPQQKQALEQRIKQQQEILNTPIPIITDSGEQKVTVVDFVPNKIDLDDWSNQNKQQWMQRANQAAQPGVSNLHQATLPLIQQVLERWINTTHPKLKHSEDDIQVSMDDYQRLQSIIKSFLGTEIGWDKNGFSTIFGRPISKAQLSAGQRVLLQLCVAIYAQGGTFSEHIIFMDEPENHLHPSVVIDLLDTIKEHNPNGQIWIATHSIPLLSHFDAPELWFVEDGTVKHSGKKPEQVLKSLLGNEERIQKLKDLLTAKST